MRNALIFIRLATAVGAAVLLVHTAAGAFSTVNGALTTALKVPH